MVWKTAFNILFDSVSTECSLKIEIQQIIYIKSPRYEFHTQISWTPFDIEDFESSKL